MSRADLIPLSLLRDLAARLPDPIRPTSFVDLAVYMARSAPAAPAPAPVADAASAPSTTAPGAPAPAPIVRGKKGLPWTLEELQQARDLLNGGKGPSEVARILGRPVAATQIAIKRYGVRGAGPITVPGRPKGRFKKALPAESSAPARKPKAAPKAKAPPPRKAKVAPRQAPPVAEPTPAITPPVPRKTAPAAPSASTPPPAPKAVCTPEAATAEADPKRANPLATLQAAVADKQPGRQIRVLSHLLTLPRDSFTPGDDLFLAEGLTTRRAPAEIADQLGCEAADVTARWKAMLFSDLTDRHGHILLDGQADLLRALRWLADRETQSDD